MKSITLIILLIFAVLTSSPSAAGSGTENTTDQPSTWSLFWRGVKDDWKKIGKDAKESGTEVGRDVKDGFQKVPEDFRKGFEEANSQLSISIGV